MKKIILFLAICYTTGTAAAEHPFLIVKKSEYPELQARAETAPWLQIKHDAIEQLSKTRANPNNSYKNRAKAVSTVMSANSLAYILDPDNRPLYLQRMLDHFEYWDRSTPGNIRDELKAIPWPYNVPPGGAFFNSVIALDIIHDDLTEAQLTEINTHLTDVGNFYMRSRSSWTISDYAIRGLWSLYNGDQAAFETATRQYREVMESYLSEDSIFVEGPGYALARLTNSDREQKHFFMDILEYQNADNWYDDPRMQACFEWLTGSAITPSKRIWPFGDTSPVVINSEHNTGLVRAASFSDNAGSYAHYIQPDATIPGRLLTYLTITHARPVAHAAHSCIYPDGGAFFRETNNSKAALAAVLWNPCKSKPHSHFEVNAIAIAGYGHLLLGNSGYNGWGNDFHGFTWDYIKFRAVSANTVLFDYTVENENNPSEVNNHVEKFGNGLLAGITSSGFDMALGDSGNAIPNGKQLRTLAFVHPQDGIDGYFITWDEVAAANAGAIVNLVFHPYSHDLNVVNELTEYRWTMDGSNEPALSIHFATEPESVDIHEGAISSFSAEAGKVTQYIKANFATSPDTGKANLISLLYPEDATHIQPPVLRFEGPNYTGLRLKHSETVQDYIIESSDESKTHTINEITLAANSALFRIKDDSLDWYYANGTQLRNTDLPMTGFTSSAPIIIYHKDSIAQMQLSEATKIVFFQPDAIGIRINGVEQKITQMIDNELRISLPAGDYEFEFITTTAN